MLEILSQPLSHHNLRSIRLSMVFGIGDLFLSLVLFFLPLGNEILFVHFENMKILTFDYL